MSRYLYGQVSWSSILQNQLFLVSTKTVYGNSPYCWNIKIEQAFISFGKYGNVSAAQFLRNIQTLL